MGLVKALTHEISPNDYPNYGALAIIPCNSISNINVLTTFNVTFTNCTLKYTEYLEERSSLDLINNGYINLLCLSLFTFNTSNIQDSSSLDLYFMAYEANRTHGLYSHYIDSDNYELFWIVWGATTTVTLEYRMRVGGVTVHSITQNITLSLNVYNHFNIHHSANTVVIYVNGTQRATTTDAGANAYNITGPENVRIGFTNNISGSPDYYCNGNFGFVAWHQGLHCSLNHTSQPTAKTYDTTETFEYTYEIFESTNQYAYQPFILGNDGLYQNFANTVSLGGGTLVFGFEEGIKFVAPIKPVSSMFVISTPAGTPPPNTTNPLTYFVSYLNVENGMESLPIPIGSASPSGAQRVRITNNNPLPSSWFIGTATRYKIYRLNGGASTYQYIGTYTGGNMDDSVDENILSPSSTLGPFDNLPIADTAKTDLFVAADLPPTPTLTNATLVAGGTLTSGSTYEYLITRYDEILGIESGPSNLVTATPSAGNLTVAVNSPSSPGNHYVYKCYRRNVTSNEQFYYYIGSTTSGGASFNDTGFANSSPRITDPGAFDSILNCAYAEQHLNRLWQAIPASSTLFPEYKRTIVFSEDGDFFRYYTNNFILIGETNTPITGLVSFLGNLVVFKEKEIYAIVGNSPANFRVITISKEYGCSSANSITIYSNKLRFANGQGVYSFDGINVTKISKTINNLYLANMTDSVKCTLSSGVFASLGLLIISIGSNLSLVYNIEESNQDEELWYTFTANTFTSFAKSTIYGIDSVYAAGPNHIQILTQEFKDYGKAQNITWNWTGVPVSFDINTYLNTNKIRCLITPTTSSQFVKLGYKVGSVEGLEDRTILNQEELIKSVGNRSKYIAPVIKSTVGTTERINILGFNIEARIKVKQ